MSARVLLVEDDPWFAGIVCDYLVHAGATVDLAVDGADALAQAEQRLPDIVVSDVLLPKVSGVEVAARMHGLPGAAELPIVLMSAIWTDDAGIAARLRQCGASAWLRKPFGMDELRATLGKLLPDGAFGGPAPAPEPDLECCAPVVLPTGGNVGPAVLADLLLGARGSAFTGVLRLDAADRWKEIVLLSGRPVWADGGDEHDRLGTMLLEEGRIGRPGFERAVRAMRERGIDFGSALTDLGLLGATELYAALRRLVGRRVVAAFSWRVGRFSIDARYPRQTSAFEVAALPLVWRGIEQHGGVLVEPGWTERRDDRHVVPTARFREGAAELADVRGVGDLLAVLDGRRTVAQLRRLDLLRPAEFDRALGLLYRAGMIGFGAGPRSHQTPAPAPAVSQPTLTGIADRVLRDWLRLWQAHFYDVFSLPLDATDEAIVTAIAAPVLSWSVEDLPARLPAEVRRKARSLHGWVDEAREVLADPERRAAYRARLEEGVSGVYRRVGRPDDELASLFFQLGRDFLQTRNWTEAADAFARAAESTPASGVYRGYLAYARYREAGSTRPAADKAARMLEDALATHPHQPMIWFFLGLVERDRKRYRPAIDAFEASVRHDPSYAPAQRALAETQDLAGIAAKG